MVPGGGRCYQNSSARLFAMRPALAAGPLTPVNLLALVGCMTLALIQPAIAVLVLLMALSHCGLTAGRRQDEDPGSTLSGQVSRILHLERCLQHPCPSR
ncbi:hypothetical protein EVJ50_11280 [Synechococcus sp. RSCCF101]|uniref:hypothetical protein n=1 Tax=Synechococcus sp. RSCCF101 TaxID=2511069 RepID=UPI001245DB45|nr:hypothetical protein [Synechococcus sp. RSCCF101]QEY32720.1 hypothetical protein EVJ50_11280 [Synechococcus sp. RSCCF101]